MVPLKITSIGNSEGVIFPKEMLARLKVRKGDQIYAMETPNGGYELHAGDPLFARKMQLAEEIMREDRDVLKLLAQ